MNAAIHHPFHSRKPVRFLSARYFCELPQRSIGWGEAFALSVVSIGAAVPGVMGAYLVKSALGINLMSGPSPLHDLLYVVFF